MSVNTQSHECSLWSLNIEATPKNERKEEWNSLKLIFCLTEINDCLWFWKSGYSKQPKKKKKREMIGKNSWKLCFVIEMNNCLWLKVFWGQQPKRRGKNSLKRYFITEINNGLWFRVLSFHLQLTVKQWANGKNFWVRIRCPWKWITMFWVLYFGFSSM